MSDKNKALQSLIINSPFEAPAQHWEQAAAGKGLVLQQGRRPAGYELYDTRNNTRRVVPLNMVNQIRTRVDDWRAARARTPSTSVSSKPSRL